MKAKKLLAATLGCAALLSLFLFSLLDAKSDPQKRIEALDKFTQVLNMVEQSYVDDENISDLVDKSIDGLLKNLDPHSNFLNAKAFDNLISATKGEFGGLGISVSVKDGSIVIIAPMEDTPADKAGLKANDIIMKIDGEFTKDMNLDDAVAKMRGKAGTKITLTIYRKGEEKPFDVTLTRANIKVPSVYAKLIPDENMLYLRITTFDKNVVDGATKAIRENPKARGIVMDLRNNGGGLLMQAVGLVNLFSGDGVIVSQKGRAKGQNEEYKANPRAKLTSLPLVVLVNGGTASASEITAGALQDFKRAIIVGENTFGKGSVQQIMPISKSEAVKFTTARYYLPSGRTIQNVGITPDIEVFPGKVSQKEEGWGIKEADLKGHISSGAEAKKESKAEAKKEDKKIITKEQINEDVQLKTAIDAVKILSLGQAARGK